MSSRGSSPAPAVAAPVKQGQVTFRFCQECSNLLYPKVDNDNKKLMYTCRNCAYTEPATSNCVYRNILKNTAGETAGVTQDVGSDPTLPREIIKCPRPGCDSMKAVFFQSQQRTRETGMKLYYVCCKCGEIFEKHNDESQRRL